PSHAPQDSTSWIFVIGSSEPCGRAASGSRAVDREATRRSSTHCGIGSWGRCPSLADSVRGRRLSAGGPPPERANGALPPWSALSDLRTVSDGPPHCEHWR